MTAEHISSALTRMGSAFANHIWQSTAFAAIVCLLTLLLRRHQARIRFSLWLAASIKFLVPFSLLIALGGTLPKPQHVVTNSQTGLYAAIDVAGRPFSVSSAPSTRSAVAARSLQQRLIEQLPLVFGGIWLFGAFVVLLIWVARWRQVSAILRRSSPVQHGHEVRLLRRLEETAGRQGHMALRLSPERMEPGVFGIVRPVLIWPEWLSERLDEEQMEAILAHEMTHQRRHDNLAAAIHMLVEVLFWFHPMVWWMERRMVEEREHACDEAVVRLGSSPEAYAEGLLKACRFCVEARLACVSGITGADLNRRVRAIMTLRIGRELGLKGKLLLLSAASLAIIAPVMLGLWHRPTVLAQTTPPTSQAQAADGSVPAFDVVSIKPHRADDPHTSFGARADGYSATNVSLKWMIWTAYEIRMPDLILDAPGWADSERFDVTAKMDAEAVDRFRKLSNEEQRKQMDLMLQGMLADRFGLKVHHGTKELTAYALVVAKNGFRLKEADPKNTYAEGIQGPKGPAGAGSIAQGLGKLTGQGIPISRLAEDLGDPLESFVEDRTGISGKYDISLHWDPDPNRAANDEASSGAGDEPSLFTALQNQLGLKLIPVKVPMDSLIIDHVARPPAN
jgi:bla regulator protein blaR1